MGCKKGKSTHKKKKDHFECKKCGAVVKNKGKVCKPKRLKD
ncbi:hypothetical protein [Pontiella agarivorans]|uniref:30S ribosomal protein S27ae n=1 Tax=Pontiella agarivorans TaxID=3038953 RepID=A0ABU5N1R1_9BACT|nr:hypothetical protein [Pontiella agarivorans]MDZ8120389.1 hypothetical protein [Pontiella agarivorans]